MTGMAILVRQLSEAASHGSSALPGRFGAFAVLAALLHLMTMRTGLP